jgi:hypothetical protein
MNPFENPAIGLKTYRRHRCNAEHQTRNMFMRCAIPRAVYVSGEGEFALIAWCDGRPSVTLWSDLAARPRRKRAIDGGACGGRCCGHHEIVRVLP